MKIFGFIKNIFHNPSKDTVVKTSDLPAAKQVNDIPETVPSISVRFKTRDAIWDEKTQQIIHDTSNDALVSKELTFNESLFFEKLINYSKNSNLNGFFEIERNTFRDYIVYFESNTFSCYVGRVNFYIGNDKYAVKKAGASRASRVFDSEKLAKEYIASRKGNYTIEHRSGEDRRYLQYLTVKSDIDDTPPTIINPKDIQGYLNAIPFWIDYIKELQVKDKQRMQRLKSLKY